MTSTTKFIDANIFIERWSNPKAEQLTNSLNREEHCTSVLVLAEVYHKLNQKNVNNVFGYIRSIMGAIKVYDFTQQDFFDAVKNTLDVEINDKIHLAVMRNNNVSAIISFDKGFDKDKAIKREDP